MTSVRPETPSGGGVSTGSVSALQLLIGRSLVVEHVFLPPQTVLGDSGGQGGRHLLPHDVQRRDDVAGEEEEVDDGQRGHLPNINRWFPDPSWRLT